MTLLSLRDLSVTLRDRPVFSGVTLDIEPGELVGLIGPNGAGKTTLMRAALGLLPHEGQSCLAELDPGARARAVAWMPQMREIAWPVTVEALVTLGRTPHRARALSQADRAAVTRALDWMDLSDMRNRTATRLSGGEQARVLIARALAQDTPLLLADEPVSGLDPAHQIATMRTFGQVARSGRAVLVSLHDLGLAARHCSRLILLGQGRVVADGPPGQVLTPELVAQVFGITAFSAATEHGHVFQPLEVLE
ncbi:ABC transporter ATP-binding protein [Lutimaribacter sp. EGI FJ00015]|uniref:ABC transporter ATP-binding protein n=1 Tax=Lutimaribacter degradans TaxID=2945989 RepID=A0ACC5ZZM6_9RHOB|nr:ABC transporter ATP-binding protein [Lutimaribacter sp. EGI FJ00013]MCM2562989.1 ABC transporter ATP-binding protein [Lutimaribacter sp. EGI FJ00013]MCO0614157.1 ABC transporter ATP-binding protein [Lutimaribacter sp. EGI FJ00015]MCO0636134.1 ABC transporter ATP-binding protein [Lutimaribacter sp. EGI FJ00014]